MALRTGSADLPLHGGRVPPWLATRMASLGRVIVEAIAYHYGRDEVLRRLAHPFWFQSFGAVMGMDWHSSGITTSVLGALKRGLQPIQHELGVYVCGGRGKHSRKTPDELRVVGEKTGLDAAPLARASRLVAKIDHAAVQDGFDLYLHGFIVTAGGKWCVVQQGMSDVRGEARRYHWLSENFDDADAARAVGAARLAHGRLADGRLADGRLADGRLADEQFADGRLAGERGGRGAIASNERFLNSPHAAIEGRNRGVILNLADTRADASRRAGMELVHAGPDRTISVLRQLREKKGSTLSLFPEIDRGLVNETRPLPHLRMPAHHDVRASDVELRRLHAALAAAADRGPEDFAELLLTPGVGARTVESLALVAEVVHGAPARFSDPARFSMAHGGKDGHPFPVPLRVYDETIRVLKGAVDRAKLGNDEKLAAIRRLDTQARSLERVATGGPSFDEYVRAERDRSPDYDGRTV
jgi:hypothetical protein